MDSRQKKVQQVKSNSSKKLRTNLRILKIVYGILLLISLYNIIVSQAIFWQVLLAAVIGFVVGVVSSRMYKIAWDNGEANVIGTIDFYGVAVLVLFVAFELNRTRIAELFVSGESIGSISLLLVTTALLGRIVGTYRRILQIINQQASH